MIDFSHEASLDLRPTQFNDPNCMGSSGPTMKMFTLPRITQIRKFCW